MSVTPPGYAHICTDGQTMATQHGVLRQAGITRVHQEPARGGRRDRPELQGLGAGNTVVVWKLDRLSRSLADLVRILEPVRARGAGLRSLTEPIDTTAAGGGAAVGLVGVFAQLERVNLRERTHARIQTARVRGGPFGRPRKLIEAQRQDIVRRVGAGDLTAAEAARHYGAAPTTIARVLRRHRAPTLPTEIRP